MWPAYTAIFTFAYTISPLISFLFPGLFPALGDYVTYLTQKEHYDPIDEAPESVVVKRRRFKRKEILKFAAPYLRLNVDGLEELLEEFGRIPILGRYIMRFINYFYYPSKITYFYGPSRRPNPYVWLDRGVPYECNRIRDNARIEDPELKDPALFIWPSSRIMYNFC